MDRESAVARVRDGSGRAPATQERVRPVDATGPSAPVALPVGPAGAEPVSDDGSETDRDTAASATVDRRADSPLRRLARTDEGGGQPPSRVRDAQGVRLHRLIGAEDPVTDDRPDPAR